MTEHKRIYLTEIERNLCFNNVVSEPLGYIVGDIVDNGFTDNTVEIVTLTSKEEIFEKIQNILDVVNSDIPPERIKVIHSTTFTGKKSCIPIFDTSNIKKLSSSCNDSSAEAGILNKLSELPPPTLSLTTLKAEVEARENYNSDLLTEPERVFFNKMLGVYKKAEQEIIEN